MSTTMELGGGNFSGKYLLLLAPTPPPPPPPPPPFPKTSSVFQCCMDYAQRTFTIIAGPAHTVHSRHPLTPPPPPSSPNPTARSLTHLLFSFQYMWALILDDVPVNHAQWLGASDFYVSVFFFGCKFFLHHLFLSCFI